ncbi:competence type IV pilus minor pilin ComGD [Mesobacillus subterraneus]|uniref:competence type IV pilus minor pilin ComGD n=1 Tax=Mesobacillus subterraneus TaxID=285983 RepID=UPI00273DE572|nr:competence type IV pilus minor pilin ComGD [Mesobacillus subterraneus]WLR57628.1 competence type IV pilus minor pilin ComGD [Mesobacillus subterraneus]
MNNSDGFTLVEMLIVLSAFLMLTLTSTFLFSPQKDMLEKDLFFSQLRTDLLYSQQYAISHQETITVHIMPENNYYYIRGTDYAAPYLSQRHYSSRIKLKKGTMNLVFHYMPDGNIDSFGSLYVTAGSKKYKLMIQIGKGRFYVLEE